MKKNINIAVVGLGQVGIYLLNELNTKKKDFELKTGKKINVVAVSAVVETLISAAFIVASANGKIVNVGNPLCIVLIVTVTGILVDLDEKNKSILGIKTPPGVVTKNDCATGSP